MRQDVYSVAYEEANSELLDITKRFEQLRRRKESLESLIAAISPILGLSEVPSRAQLRRSSRCRERRNPLENQQLTHLIRYLCRSPKRKRPGDDPFQRRVRNALKLGNSNQEHRGLQTAV